MDTNRFVIYLHEIHSQCLFTRAAFTIFNRALEQKEANGALFAGQAALTSAAQVASLLWPARARARRRGEVLREKLGLPERHALADRRFVELWDHADGKFDEWVKKTHGQQVLFDFVGPARALNIPDLKDEGIYRLYDTETKIFVFRGVGYNMQNLAQAIEEIGKRAETLLKQIFPGRYDETARKVVEAGTPAGLDETAVSGAEVPQEVAEAANVPAAAAPAIAANEAGGEEFAGLEELPGADDIAEAAIAEAIPSPLDEPAKEEKTDGGK